MQGNVVNAVNAVNNNNNKEMDHPTSAPPLEEEPLDSWEAGRKVAIVTEFGIQQPCHAHTELYSLDHSQWGGNRIINKWLE